MLSLRGTILTQDSSDRGGVRYSLPLYFDGKDVADIQFSLLVEDVHTRSPLLAYTKETQKLRLRSGYLPKQQRNWYQAVEFTNFVTNAHDIDPYDLSLLIAMAQASARIEQLRAVRAFRPCVITPCRDSKSLNLYTTTISREYLRCLDEPYTPIRYGIHISRATLYWTEPDRFLDFLGSALELHARLGRAAAT
ncbi:MAG: hypothetical protein M1840_001476 [Geoglossum simile]|nr:MAG: hypothetical protein M1840_001476 [Geoglossum simile]